MNHPLNPEGSTKTRYHGREKQAPERKGKRKGKRAASSYSNTSGTHHTTTLQQKHGHVRSSASWASAHIDKIDHTCTLSSPRLAGSPPAARRCARFRRRRAARKARRSPLPLSVGRARKRGAHGRHSTETTRARDETVGDAAASTCTREPTHCAPTNEAHAAGGSNGAARALGGSARGRLCTEGDPSAG